MVESVSEPVARLHIITHLNWQREGYQTFDQQRAHLLDVLAGLVSNLQNNKSQQESALKHFLLGGQTIILDDIAAVRPQLLTALIIYSAAGRLGIGPWYIQADSILAGGESLIRNLLLGQTDMQRHGAKSINVAYMPQACQNAAQLPQILQGFGIECAFLCSGQTSMPLPFRWEAPDGSSVLVINYQQSDTIMQAINMQRKGQPDGPFLWMNPADDEPLAQHNSVAITAEIPTIQSTLEDYMWALRERLPDDMRPLIKGSLYLQAPDRVNGRFSARTSLKQALAHLQAELVHFAEPLLAVALTHGKVQYPENQRALLDYGWRLLLQNQARHTLSGAINDDVYDETIIRNRRIKDNSQRVIQSALNALPGERIASVRETTSSQKQVMETYIIVWNPHGHPVRQLVELSLSLPDKLYPAVLVGPSRAELPFHWNPEKQQIGFLADVSPVGYQTYTLTLSPDVTTSYNLKRVSAARMIGGNAGESFSINNGRTEWTVEQQNISDLLSFHDGGDAGDVWSYQKPDPDVEMRAGIVDAVQVEATPTYERLIMRHRMRIAPGLKNGNSRERGLKVLDLTTTATYYNELRGLYFRTTLTNNAEDHRLRAHIRTGFKAQHIYTDSAFAIAEQNTAQHHYTGPWPMHSLCSAHDSNRGIALFTRGLQEVESIEQNEQTTLALTVLRAVGWLNKPQKIPAKGAQLPGQCTAEFMLLPVDPRPDLARLMQISQSYQTPLRAYQYASAPQSAQRSYLHLESDRAVMTALKPRQEGSGWIVRLLNPTKDATEAKVQVYGKLRRVTQVNMAEQMQSELEAENNQLSAALKPHQTLTLHLEFT